MEYLHNITDNEIALVARNCDDSYYNDFIMRDYLYAILQAKKEIARRFAILQRLFVVKNGNGEAKLTFNIPSFLKEVAVKVNGIDYSKRLPDSLEDGQYHYSLEYKHNSYEFNYKSAAKNDIIEFFYLSDVNASDYEIDEIMPIIPAKYSDKIIKLATQNIASLGIIRFKDEKKNKYTILYRMNGVDDVNDQAESSEIIEMKPFLIGAMRA